MTIGAEAHEHVSDLNVSLSSQSVLFSMMFDQVAVCTQGFQVAIRIVGAIAISMMNNECTDVGLRASLTPESAKAFDRASITENGITQLGGQCAVDDGSALSRTETTCPTLECLATSNDFSAQLARGTLNARTRAIPFTTTYEIDAKWSLARFADPLNVSGLVTATLGAVDLPLLAA